MTLTRSVVGRRRGAAAALCAIALTVTACSTPSNPAASSSPSAVSAAAAGSSVAAAGSAGASSSGPFSARPTEPFKPSTGATTPTGLPKRLAAAMQVVNVPAFAEVADAMKQAATKRGYDFVETVSDNDSAKSVDQLGTILTRKVGAAFIWNTDPVAQAPVEQKLMNSGAALFTLSHGPGTTPMVAVQRQLGVALGKDAADYITTKLGGKAQVVIFNEDSSAPIKPRYQGIRDELAKAGSGVKIVSDVTDNAADPTFGFETMNTILQKYPDVNVVLGLDATVLSALSAMQNAGKATPDKFLGGIGGDPKALKLIAAGGGPYKVSSSFNTSLWGYAAGMWGADWVEGKNVPQLCVIKPFLLTNATTIAQFSADLADPAGTYAKKMSTYMQLLGTVNYTDRTNIWNSTDPSNSN